jgi:hypothetical protein
LGVVYLTKPIKFLERWHANEVVIINKLKHSKGILRLNFKILLFQVAEKMILKHIQDKLEVQKQILVTCRVLRIPGIIPKQKELQIISNNLERNLNFFFRNNIWQRAPPHRTIVI